MGTVNMNNLLDTSPAGTLEASLLANQHSIYSLLLDEFQNSLGETGKNCGSMNMEEFLKNVMTAEENHAASDFSRDGLARQASLLRQGFLTLPRTLSRKTVDEVWKDVYQGPGAVSPMDGNGDESAGARQQKQTSFGEMTLQDFLVKAGVVRDNIASESHSSSPYGGASRDTYDFGLVKMGTTDSCNEKVRVQPAASEKKEFSNSQGRVERGNARVVSSLTLSPASVLSSQTAMDVNQSDSYKSVVSPEWFNPQYRNITHTNITHQQQQLFQQQMSAEAAAYFDVAKRVSNAGGALGVGMGEIRSGNSFGGLAGAIGTLGHVVPGQNVCVGFGTASGGGMGVLALGSGSPVSPNSDGGGHSHPYGFGLPALASYRIDGSVQGRKMESEMQVQKVVERRHRRMIKNRESAARSRARKQAYTTELESEVTQLKEENRKLRRQQEEAAERKKKMKLELNTTSLIRRSSPIPKQLRRTATGP